MEMSLLQFASDSTESIRDRASQLDLTGAFMRGFLGALAALFVARYIAPLFWEARNLTKEELGFRILRKREPQGAGELFRQIDLRAGYASEYSPSRGHPYADRVVRGNIMWQDVIEVPSEAVQAEQWKGYQHLRTRILRRKAIRIDHTGKKRYLMVPRQLDRLVR